MARGTRNSRGIGGITQDAPQDESGSAPQTQGTTEQDSTLAHWLIHPTRPQTALTRSYLDSLKLFSVFQHANCVHIFGGRSLTQLSSSFLIYRRDRDAWEKRDRVRDYEQPFRTMACASCMVKPMEEITVKGKREMREEAYFAMFGGLNNDTNPFDAAIDLDQLPPYMLHGGQLCNITDGMYTYNVQSGPWKFNGPDLDDAEEMSIWPRARVGATISWRRETHTLILIGGFGWTKEISEERKHAAKAEAIAEEKKRNGKKEKNSQIIADEKISFNWKTPSVPLEVLSEVAEYNIDEPYLWTYHSTIYVDDRTGRIHPGGVKRCFHSSVIHGTRLFVFGGYDFVPHTLKEDEITDAIYTLDLQLKRWYRIPLLTAFSPMCDTRLQPLYENQELGPTAASNAPHLMISGTIVEGEKIAHHSFMVNLPKYLPTLLEADCAQRRLMQLQKSEFRSDVEVICQVTRKRGHSETNGAASAEHVNGSGSALEPNRKRSKTKGLDVLALEAARSVGGV